VGYGHIGKKVEKLVTAFGAKTLVYSRSYQTSSLGDLFKQADIVTLHLALAKETKNLVGENLLLLMKPTAFLINASRGEIIDEEALCRILTEKKIASAALDVFWQEPLLADSRFRKLPNVILTPHLGASTKEALEKASKTVINDVIAVLKGGKPVNQVKY
jgi:D-3-phosphoglycerate dehydrogenase